MKNTSKIKKCITLFICLGLIWGCEQDNIEAPVVPSDAVGAVVQEGSKTFDLGTVEAQQLPLNRQSLQSGCGDSFSGRSTGTGYHITNENFTVSPCPNGQTRRIAGTVRSYDVPNRFQFRDAAGRTKYISGWMGVSNESGPWGGSLDPRISKNYEFTTSGGGTFKLTVETVVHSHSDSWNVSVGCSCVCNVSYTINNSGGNSTICWQTNCNTDMCQRFDVRFADGRVFYDQRIGVIANQVTCTEYGGGNISSVTLKELTVGGCPSSLTNGRVFNK